MLHVRRPCTARRAPFTRLVIRRPKRTVDYYIRVSRMTESKDQNNIIRTRTLAYRRLIVGCSPSSSFEMDHTKTSGSVYRSLDSWYRFGHRPVIHRQYEFYRTLDNARKSIRRRRKKTLWKTKTVLGKKDSLVVVAISILACLLACFAKSR